MKYAPLILILLILFISVMYIKNNVSKFVCACEKEDFIDRIADNVPVKDELPKFSKLEDLINFLKMTASQQRHVVRALRDSEKNPDKLKIITELITLLDTLHESVMTAYYTKQSSTAVTPTLTAVTPTLTAVTPTLTTTLPAATTGSGAGTTVTPPATTGSGAGTTVTPPAPTVPIIAAPSFRAKLAHESDGCYTYLKNTPLKGCMLRDDGKIRSRGKFVDAPRNNGPRRCDNAAGATIWKTSERTKYWDDACAVNMGRPTTKSECENPAGNHYRCSWYGNMEEGFANYPSSTTDTTGTVEEQQYKIIVTIAKKLFILDPTIKLAISLDTITNKDIGDVEYCKFWNFFYDIGIAPAGDYTKCFMQKKGTGAKTFFNDQTSMFNFSTKNLENTAPTHSLTSGTFLHTDTAQSSNKGCANQKSISNEIKYLDMDKYLLKTEILPSPDMSEYVKKKDLGNFKIDKSKYILKSKIPAPRKIPDPSKYILKSKLKPQKAEKKPIYGGPNIASGPLDMTMDYSLYPLKSRFNTCSYATVDKKHYKKKPPKDDNNNEYNSDRLPQCKVQRNIVTPDIFAR